MKIPVLVMTVLREVCTHLSEDCIASIFSVGDLRHVFTLQFGYYASDKFTFWRYLPNPESFKIVSNSS